MNFRRLSFAWLLLIACRLISLPADAAPKKPFPQAPFLEYGGSKPDHHSQPGLNAAVLKAYRLWKEHYLVESALVPGDYKIAFNPEHWTVSEAMGYGMLITVQMAGADPEARLIFDGLNRFRKRYPSSIDPAFMNWRIQDEAKARKNDSATDGDMDMAMALLMAEAQWGGGSYGKEAAVLIAALGRTLVRPDDSLRLGDWDASDSEDKVGTRSSDFTTAHFRAFAKASGDPLWKRVEEKCYTILEQLQRDSAPATGLVPDFAVRQKDGSWKPALPGFLEGKNDGAYAYNACRVPWRIGFSAVYHHEPRAKAIVDRLMTWAAKTLPGPANFMATYGLNGKVWNNYSEPAFSAPMGVAAMASDNVPWLNASFDLAAGKSVDYYSDSIALLCLLVMSGNAWLP